MQGEGAACWYHMSLRHHISEAPCGGMRALSPFQACRRHASIFVRFRPGRGSGQSGQVGCFGGQVGCFGGSILAFSTKRPYIVLQRNDYPLIPETPRSRLSETHESPDCTSFVWFFSLEYFFQRCSKPASRQIEIKPLRGFFGAMRIIISNSVQNNFEIIL